MNEQSKPREWWLTDCTDNSGWQVETKFSHARHFGSCNVFHVIEKSAFDQLKAENERLRDALKEIESGKVYLDGKLGRTPKTRARKALAEGEK